MIEIDGSMGEGGGSVVRIAVALSAASRQPVRIFNIRAKRPKPGLQRQHLAAVKAVASLCNASVGGLELGSTELVFKPGRISTHKLRIDVGTAGSTMLVLQALMPVAAFAPKPIEVEIRGGTDNPLAPPVDYIKHVTIPALRKLGYRIELECLQRGYYPSGGGEVRARLYPVKHLSAVSLRETEDIAEVRGIAYVSRLPEHIARRMAHSAARELISAGLRNVKIQTKADPAPSPGGGIVLWATSSSGNILGASKLAEKGVPAENIGRTAAEDLIGQLRARAPVDRHLADQLIPYMALAVGDSCIRCSELTMHAVTNLDLTRKLLGTASRVEGNVGEPATIWIKGVGLRNPNAIPEPDRV
jgi:RNA 3'-phosphate cyclase